METLVPQISTVKDLAPGTLFVLIGSKKGSPLCLRAAYDLPEEEADEAHRVIPLHWPENEGIVGVTVYARNLPGKAVELKGARLEVDPLSACSLDVASPTAVYARDGELFLPTRSVHDGSVESLVNAATGVILPSRSGSFTVFTGWSITIPGDGDERLHIFPLREASDENN